MRVVVVGGGASGFSAARVAKATGTAEVVLIERMDTLGGFALVAGIGLCGAGAFAVLAEAKALGGAGLYTDVLFPIATHAELDMPGFDRAMLYNVTKLDAGMRRVLAEDGVDLHTEARVVRTEKNGRRVEAVELADGTRIEGDVFVDATGSVSGLPGCTELGVGCVECVLRCLPFGDPRGLVDDDVALIQSLDGDGNPGVTGTSYLVPIASLSTELQAQVADRGYAYITVPPGVRPDDSRGRKAGSNAMAIMSQAVVRENILLADIGGYVKATANAAPRYAGTLRDIPGLEDAVIAMPLAGHRGHAVEGLTMVPRDDAQRVHGFDNLLCAGIKASHALFLLDVTCSGDFAGYNAARMAAGLVPVELPPSLAIGAFIKHVNTLTASPEGLRQSPQADAKTLEKLGVYRATEEEAAAHVAGLGLDDLYRRPVTDTPAALAS